LGAVPLAGCFGLGFGDECERNEDCDTKDGNECTVDICRVVMGSFGGGKQCLLNQPVGNGTDCTFDGAAGVCVSGVCGENLCEGVVCDDENACTDDRCIYVDGTCEFTSVVCDDRNECTDDTCNPAYGCIFAAVEDGTFCFEGTCKVGDCVVPTDACTNAEDLAVVCDPGFTDEVETCSDVPDGFAAALCLVENTGVSTACATCYGATIDCIYHNCGAECDGAVYSQACDDCRARLDRPCDAQHANCTGDLASACPPGGTMSDVGAFETQP
jgi:hypothetical protein